MTTQPPIYNPPLPFRAPDVTQEQLAELKKKWGENRTKVIIRCIERAWWQEIGSIRVNENSDEETIKNG